MPLENLKKTFALTDNKPLAGLRNTAVFGLTPIQEEETFPSILVTKSPSNIPPISREGVDILTETFKPKNLYEASKQVLPKISETFIPSATEFLKTTGGIMGEGLAYALDKNVREQYAKGNTDILPTISKTSLLYLSKKTGGVAIEQAIFKFIPSTLKTNIYARFGKGALQGLGFAVSEGMAKDYSMEQIIDNAKSYASFAGAIEIVVPYLPAILGAKMKDMPKITGQAIKDVGVELKEYPLKKTIQAVQKDVEQQLIKQGYTAIEAKKLAESGGYVGKLPEKKITPKISKELERGFITSAKEAIPEANKIAGQYIPRDTDNLAIMAKNLIKTDINTAENLALHGTDDKAVATASELLKFYREEAEKATSNAIKNALYEKAAKVANTIAPKLTEQGRAIQAASILGRLTPEGQVKFAASQIIKYNEGVSLAKKIPELTGKQTKYIVDEMKVINEMVEGTEKAMRFQKLQNYIQDLVPTPLIKKVIAVWKAGLLTGIKTTGVNILANLSHAGTEITKDIPATMVDKIVSLFTGKRSISATLKGLFTGGKEGVSKGLRYLTTGFDERNIGTKLDFKRINFGKGKLAKALQTYTDTVFHLLGAEDQPFYYAAKLRSFYSQAKAEAINKGLKGQEAQKFIDNLIQNPTDEMIKYATIDAETAVFQNKTLLGQAAKKIQEVPGGEVVVPFGRTPSAVATQIINYSPVGVAKTIFQNVGKGKFDQRLFSQGIGRGLTGTAVMALGYEMMKKGLLSLARPTGEKEQKLWELEGRQANSFYDPVSKKWRQIQVLGPVGNLLIMGGYFQREFEKSGSPSEAIANSLAGSSQSFSQQTFLTGVSNFIDAISDPARSAKNVAGSTLASSIPTIVGDIARATDTKERRANEIFDKFMARIPGIRETLEPQVNVLGQEKETVGNPLEIMADPTRPSPVQSTPLIQELRRLWDEGFKVSPTLLGDKNGYSSLTPQENTQLWKKSGEIINSKLSNLIKQDDYQKLPDDEKEKYINQFVDKAKTNARAEMVLQLTQGLQGEQLLKKLSELKKSGLMTREVFKKFNELR